MASKTIYHEDEYLMISEIQHFYFCKRQWGLIHIEQQWNENEYTIEGHLLHKKVDNPFIVESRDDVIVSRAVPISSKYLGLSGIIDVLEFIRDKEGINLPGKVGLWRPNIVEYKRGKPKPDHRDIVQLVAQVICLEEQINYRIKTSEFYYGEIRRRVKIDITDELRKEVHHVVQEMHSYFKKRETPKAEFFKNCTLCSLYDLCLPRLTKKKVNVRNYIEKHIREVWGK